MLAKVHWEDKVLYAYFGSLGIWTYKLLPSSTNNHSLGKQTHRSRRAYGDLM